jgi:hypothetical protein
MIIMTRFSGTVFLAGAINPGLVARDKRSSIYMVKYPVFPNPVGVKAIHPRRRGTDKFLRVGGHVDYMEAVT